MFETLLITVHGNGLQRLKCFSITPFVDPCAKASDWKSTSTIPDDSTYLPLSLCEISISICLSTPKQSKLA